MVAPVGHERLGRADAAGRLLRAAVCRRGDALVVSSTIASFGALGAPFGMSIGLAAPTITTHGTREQIDRLIPPAVTGQVSYCQLFSEPGAGSDLAGLRPEAVRDGEVWHLNGQKVWTSGGQYADMGMLLARTNPEVPKHQGITWFAIDMLQPGVEVRPLKEMTGHAMFNEVFLTDAEVHDENRIGDLNAGWSVANTTLLHERSGMGARGAGGGPEMAYLTRLARAGSVAGDLDKRAGDFVEGAAHHDGGEADDDGTTVTGAVPHRPGPRVRRARRPEHPSADRACAHPRHARPAEHRAKQGRRRTCRVSPTSARS